MMDQFMRIATARLRRVFPFRRQRVAEAAKMYRRWVERQPLLNKDDIDLIS